MRKNASTDVTRITGEIIEYAIVIVPKLAIVAKSGAKSIESMLSIFVLCTSLPVQVNNRWLTK